MHWLISNTHLFIYLFVFLVNVSVQFFLQEFRNTMNDSAATSKEISMAVKGYGLLAAVCGVCFVLSKWRHSGHFHIWFLWLKSFNILQNGSSLTSKIEKLHEMFGNCVQTQPVFLCIFVSRNVLTVNSHYLLSIKTVRIHSTCDFQV